MNKTLLAYGLAVLLGSGLAYSQDQGPRPGGSGDRPLRQRAEQGQYQQRENRDGQRPERPGMPDMPNREEMMKKMQERVQLLKDFEKKLEALRQYEFPDAEKNRAYHQKLDGLIKDYQALIPQRPMMQGPGREGNREGREGRGEGRNLQRPEGQRPERQRGYEAGNTNQPPRQIRERQRAQPPALE